jgi:acyl-CoA synthetase (NDP forming)
VRDVQEVPAAAAAIAGPVALKIVSRDLLHKSDAGGVALGISSPIRAGEIASEMLRAVSIAAPAARIDGFLVSEMVNGVECMIGVHPDPVFGPVLVLGAGGTAVELLQDVTRRLVPVSQEEADTMIRELRTFPLLDGYRGKPKADLAALSEAIVRMSELAYANADRIEVFEINPLMVRAAGKGAVALDCVLTTRSQP